MVGGSWSYHPPQSSQVMKMAVVFQKLLPSVFLQVLLPMAFTSDATQAGPPPVLDRAWSELAAVGITQVICLNRQVGLLTSFRKSAGLVTSTLFVHSDAVHCPLTGPQMWRIALGAVQMEPGPGA